MTTERNLGNYLYLPAYRYEGKLYVTPTPVTLGVASAGLKSGLDFWSTPDNAFYLAKTSATFVIGPEKDKNDKGYYCHYHLSTDGTHRFGGHSFFGLPFLEKF